jgi:hypothetical protein
MAQAKPFAVKGFNVSSPKGDALWCKVTEPDTMYNAKGSYSVSLVCNPKDPTVKEYVSKLEELRDTAVAETKETVGAAKAQAIKPRPVYTEEIDQDGNLTGKIVFKFKMNNVADREAPGNKIIVVDAKRQVIKDVPLVGNGSTIRCVAFANPYYMATTKEVGVSLLWTKMQLIDLVEFGGGSDDFDDEDGFEVDSGSSSNDNDELDF